MSKSRQIFIRQTVIPSTGDSRSFLYLKLIYRGMTLGAARGRLLLHGRNSFLRARGKDNNRIRSANFEVYARRDTRPPKY